MGSNGCDEVIFSGSDDTTCPEATVEIKIKTLDSQTYTLRVDKCVPVPALKEQIATVTGVLSEQQRLICRGKVLKDDQLLSAYHVEDGHTLHLVVRQPIHPSLDSFVDHSANDPASNSGDHINQSGPNVVFETFNISESGDGVLPDISRIISAVLGSFGATNIGSSSEGADHGEAVPEGFFRSTIGGQRNRVERQADQTAASGQSNPGTGGASFSASAPLDTLQLPVIPDSLTTLSQYLTRMRNEFSANVRDGGNISQGGNSLASDGQDDAGARASSSGLPTPASLADVMMSTRQLLMDQSADSLSQLARQLVDQTNVTDSLARMATQSNALRTGVLLQHLGALLLELGRTTMTLRMGQTPTEALVNAGPAVFISESSPNPIMVQPLHFQTGASFGAIPTATGQHGSGLSEGSVGSGFVPRNIDIRISTASQREATGIQQPPGQSNQSSLDGSSIHENAPAASGIPSSTRESEVQVIPIRNVVAALPASVRRVPSNTARLSVGLLYPVVARVRRVSSGNIGNPGGPRSSDGGHSGGPGSGQQPNSSSTVPQDGTGGDANVSAGDGAQNVQGFSADVPSGFDQLLRSVFTDEHINSSDVSMPAMGTISATSDSRTNQGAAAATSQESAPVSVDGDFFSHLLHQIMPMISENIAGGSAAAGEDVIENRDAQTSSTEGHENTERGTRSRRNENPPSSPSSKRQRR